MTADHQLYRGDAFAFFRWALTTEPCWCGGGWHCDEVQFEWYELQTPKCDKCGAPVSSGFMPFFCPLKDECEFMPDDEAGKAFVREQREGWT